ncbi:hypothetical protein F5888DRAFT_701927 [Russula emetica]|nr:hypothetical protein F5888DRAFT_701927 [Russula emetica]
MALQYQSRPEPMNATPHHSKVKVSVTLSDSFYIAGDAVTGKMELESRADKGLGLGIIMVELVAIEELTSRDHAATSTFLRIHRLFQGPGLPPSNAVLPHPVAEEPPLPAHHHRARRGLTTFLFRLPLPPSSPPSIDFGNGLARIRYEVRASVGVAWKDQNRLVTDKSPVDVLQRYPGGIDATGDEGGSFDFDTWPAPEGLIVGEGGKIWVQGRVLGGMLVAGESACVELQVKNHSAKRTTGLHVTFSRHLHLPVPANSADRKVPHPLQISDTLASITFRGPEYITHPSTEGIAQLVFDVPRTARTVSAYLRHGGDIDEDEAESDAFRRRTRTAPLFEVRGVLAIRIAMPVGSKDIVLELPVAVYHPATLPPPPPEPYPYPAPDIFSDPHPNHNSSASTPPPGPTPILYADRPLPSPYAYPSPPPAIPLLPQSIPAPLHTQLVIPPYRAHDGQLWFPTPPAYVGGPYQDQPPPPRPASTNVGATQASILPTGLPVSGLPISGAPEHLHNHFSYQQYQNYPPQPEVTTGHGTRAARISHHLRATSRARSASPPALIAPPTQVTVDVIAPKPMPSPKVVTETHDATDNDDPFARSFGRVGTRTRSLSVVKLEEMVARAAAETEAKASAQREGRGAAVDKTLPVPPVPSGKPSGYGANRRVFAQDIFQQMGPQEETMGRPVTEAGAEMIPHTPSLSALSILRPPPRRDGLAFPSYGGQGNEESGLDALERRLAEQVGTRKSPPLPPRDLRTVLDLGSISPLPPPPPVPAPVPVPGKKSMTQERADDVHAGAAVNESAISSLALGAEEDFGGRNANANTNPNLNLALPDVQIEGEEEAEGEDPDADGRTQRHGKGASSSSERGTYKARSRKSAKSNSKEKDKDKDKERVRSKSKEGKAKRKKKRDGRRDEVDDEAARLRSATKGRVAEWLDKLEACEPGPEPELDSSRSPPEPDREAATIAAAVATSATATAASSPTVPSPVIESKPNPRSSGFVPVSTLRRAPISLPLESASTPTPASASAPSPASTALVHEPFSSSTAATPNLTALPAPVPVRRLAHIFPPPSQVEVKYDVKSARGGRGGRVMAVAAIWAEAAETTVSSAGASAGSCSRTATPTLAPTPKQVKASRPAAAKGPKAMQSKVAATAVVGVPNKAPIKPMTSIVDPARVSPTPAPVKQRPSSPAKEKEKEKEVSRPPRARFGFGLGAAAAATPSSPAVSSSIATPVLSSTASLARSPITTTTTMTTTMTQPAMSNNASSPSSSPLRPAQSRPHPRSQPAPAPAPAAGQRPPMVNGGGLKAAELAFGQARLRDLIKRYQGQTA